ncbi:MAG: tripartite tricarboxylate transporter TctB family protein [Dehalobacterium sp.]
MGYRIGSIVLSLLFTLLGVGTLWQSSGIKNSGENLGPTFFPNMLAALVVVFGIIILVRAVMTKNEIVSFDNKKHVFLTIGLTIAFFIAWSLAHNLFYVWLFIYIMGLYAFYKQPEIKKAKVLLAGLALAGGITIFIYGVFGILIMVNF